MSQKDETAAIKIEPLNIIHSRRLAEIIGTDEKLHMQLTPSKPMQKTNAGEFYDFCSSWCKRTNSDSYAVLLDRIPIGLISLSQKDHETKIVKCGYWIESSEWGKGYTTKVFALIIKEAQKMGFKTLTCSILKDNIASVALWKRQGAALNYNDTRVIPILKIQ